MPRTRLLPLLAAATCCAGLLSCSAPTRHGRDLDRLRTAVESDPAGWSGRIAYAEALLEPGRAGGKPARRRDARSALLVLGRQGARGPAPDLAVVLRARAHLDLGRSRQALQTLTARFRKRADISTGARLPLEALLLDMGRSMLAPEPEAMEAAPKGRRGASSARKGARRNPAPGATRSRIAQRVLDLAHRLDLLEPARSAWASAYSPWIGELFRKGYDRKVLELGALLMGPRTRASKLSFYVGVADLARPERQGSTRPRPRAVREALRGYLAAAPDERSRAERHFRVAEELARRYRPTPALEHTRLCLTLAPDHAGAHRLEILMLLRGKDWAGAEAATRAYLDGLPDLDGRLKTLEALLPDLAAFHQGHVAFEVALGIVASVVDRPEHEALVRALRLAASSVQTDVQRTRVRAWVQRAAKRAVGEAELLDLVSVLERAADRQGARALLEPRCARGHARLLSRCVQLALGSGDRKAAAQHARLLLRPDLLGPEAAKALAPLRSAGLGDLARRLTLALLARDDTPMEVFRVELARLLKKKDDASPGKIRELLTLAASRFPDGSGAQVAAEILAHAGRKDEAALWYRRAAEASDGVKRARLLVEALRLGVARRSPRGALLVTQLAEILRHAGDDPKTLEAVLEIGRGVDAARRIRAEALERLVSSGQARDGDRLDLGRIALRLGQTDRAVEALAAHLRTSRSPPTAYRSILRIFQRTGATGALLRVLRGAPDGVRQDPELVTETAAVLDRRGRRGAARTLYLRALDLQAGDPRALRRTAHTLRRRGFMELALRFYQASVKGLAPGTQDLTVMQVAVKAGRLDVARRHADRFVRAHRSRALALEQVGNIFYGYLRYEDARSYLSLALAEQDRAGIAPRRLLVRLLDLDRKLGRRKEILALARRLVPDPRKRTAKESHLKLVAGSLAAVGLYEEAFPYRVAWARRRPGETSRWLDVASLHLDLGRENEAVETLALAYSEAPKAGRKPLLQGARSLLVNRERADLLVRLVETLRGEHPGRSSLSHTLGIALLLLGRFDEAHTALVRALHEAEDPAEDWKRIQPLYANLAPPVLGIAFAREALAVLPDEPEVPRALGDLYLAQGRPAKAIEAYDRFLAMAPSRAALVADRLREEGYPNDALRFYRVAAGHLTRGSAGEPLNRYVGLARDLHGDRGAREAIAYVLREHGWKDWVLSAGVDALYRAGLVADAERLLSEHLARGADSAEYKRLGFFAFVRGDEQGRRRRFGAFVQNAASTGSGGARTDRLLLTRILDVAEFLGNEGRFDEALRWLDEAHRSAPEAIRVQTTLARHALRAGRLDRSLAAMEEALRQDVGTALAEGQPVFDIAVRSGDACLFLPLVEDLPEDAGPMAQLTRYRLAASCGREDLASEALALLGQAPDRTGRKVMQVVGAAALGLGRYEDAEQVFRRQLDRWGAKVAGDRDGDGGGALGGLVRAMGMIDAREHPGGEGSTLEERVQPIARRIWEDAGLPSTTASRLVGLLSEGLNLWDTAAELCEKILTVDPSNRRMWLHRVDIALQRRADDPIAVLRRLKAAGGPVRKAFLRVRMVWMEEARSDRIDEARRALGLPEEPRSIEEAWERFDEALHRLDGEALDVAARRYLSKSRGSLTAHRKVVERLVDSAWTSHAEEALKRAMGLFPADRMLRWQSYRLALLSPSKRGAAVRDMGRWLAEVGLGSGSGTPPPTAEDLLEILRSDELTEVSRALAEGEHGKGPAATLLRLATRIRSGQVEGLAPEIERVDRGGLDVPRILVDLSVEAAAVGRETLAEDLAERVQRWAGRVEGSRALIRTLSQALDSALRSDEERRGLGRLGVHMTQSLLRVAVPSISTVTSLGTFYTAAGKPDASVRTYRALLDRLPGHAAARNNLAYHYAVRRSHIDEGLRLVNAAIRLEPGGAPFYLDTRGWLLFGKGDMEAADRDVRASLRLAPLVRGFSSEEAQIHAAEIALRRGQKLRAARHALRARLLAPESRVGARALEILRVVYH